MGNMKNFGGRADERTFYNLIDSDTDYVINFINPPEADEG